MIPATDKCALCETKITFWNGILLGAGNLAGGLQLCRICFKHINNLNPSVAFNLKKYTISDINRLLKNVAADEADIFEDPLEDIRLKITELGKEATPENIRKQIEQELNEALEADKNHAALPNSEQEKPNPKETDIFKQIEQLADLKAKGIHTDLEFEEQKKKLLDRL